MYVYSGVAVGSGVWVHVGIVGVGDVVGCEVGVDVGNVVLVGGLPAVSVSATAVRIFGL